MLNVETYNERLTRLTREINSESPVTVMEAAILVAWNQAKLGLSEWSNSRRTLNQWAERVLKDHHISEVPISTGDGEGGDGLSRSRKASPGGL
jgi:hypothetical protein